MVRMTDKEDDALLKTQRFDTLQGLFFVYSKELYNVIVSPTVCASVFFKLGRFRFTVKVKVILQLEFVCARSEGEV